MFILPINRDNPVRRVPYVLIVVIIVNCVALALTYLVYTPDTIFRQFGFTPAQHEWPTLFTSMFLHSGFWHILGNMWFLWMFGVRVENAFTKWLFLPVYVVCGLGGDGLHWLLNQHSPVPCVGASGAISGIAGRNQPHVQRGEVKPKRFRGLIWRTTGRTKIMVLSRQSLIPDCLASSSVRFTTIASTFVQPVNMPFFVNLQL